MDYAERPLLSVEDAKAWVERIRAMVGDPEAAHGEEDQLRAAVPHAIADGSPDAVELAYMPTSTEHIDFPRWCAWPPRLPWSAPPRRAPSGT